MPARSPAAKKTSTKQTAPSKRAAKKPSKKAPAKRAAGRSAATRKFAARGQRLWAAHHGQVDGERGLVLLEEACRIADRLDKLDALLKGDADVWCRLLHDTRTEDYELRIDGALIEARQQANVLRQLIASLPLKEAEGDGDAEEDWVDKV